MTTLASAARPARPRTRSSRRRGTRSRSSPHSDSVRLTCSGTPQTSPAAYLSVFFAASEASQQAGKEALGRMYARTADRDRATNWATREAQYDAVCAWGIPDHAALERVSAIEMPVFVANGDSDPMILPRYSYLLAGLIPQARLKIYPDAAHGFLFQHNADFAADVTEFLG
jgi:pimeloyl-ACP methyl ester carboxylesterase